MYIVNNLFSIAPHELYNLEGRHQPLPGVPTSSSLDHCKKLPWFLVLPLPFLFPFFETRSQYIAQAGLGLSILLHSASQVLGLQAGMCHYAI
jgi:hypothetical protein